MAQEINNNEIDIRKICRDVLAHWWWFVVGVVLCCGLGVLYMVGTTPQTDYARSDYAAAKRR